MVWANSITNILNTMADMGVFSYVIPFLLIFAVVFAILQKTKILGENRSVEAIVAIAVGLLALVNDHVPRFFATIFPRFGIGLSIFLVLIILVGFFYTEDNGKPGAALKWIGWLTGIGVVVWALVDWNFWGDGLGFSSWFGEYFWALIVLAIIIAVVVVVAKSGSRETFSGGKTTT